MEATKSKNDGPLCAPDLLDAALEYLGRGWSIIPMHVTFTTPEKKGGKKPARPWKCYQKRRANESTWRQWSTDRYVNGIGVVFGGISGGLACRDYDDLAAYDLWRQEYPDLAATLPTVATGRAGGGRHVYCLAAEGSMAKIRARLGKLGTGAIPLGDGELRAGIGCYTILPPSPHPSGCRYQWLIPLGDDLPTIDLDEAGFYRCYREGHFDAGRSGSKLTTADLHRGGIQDNQENKNQGIQKTPQTLAPPCPLCLSVARYREERGLHLGRLN
ncbi:MAG TPA: bifunctional DNA primase/polymerase [Pirellulales bacterium]|jgi:hypothetical protein|nr:bifunctional DNA primase/polymerase [Pirellulales bacterium]